MRTLLLPLLTTVLLVAWSDRAQGQDDVRPVIEKAIKALGGQEALAKQTAGRSKSKGKLEVGGGLTFTQEITYQLPNQFREETELEVAGQKVVVTTVFNGEKGWLAVNGQDQPLDAKLLAELKEVAHLVQVARLTSLLEDKAFKLSTAGDSKVDGKPAVGVRVEAKGFRDINLYFDKDTGLLLKTDRRALDTATGQEVTEERIVGEYQKVDGIQSPKKVQVHRDGKKFMEAEVVEVKLLEKVDPKVFTKPVSQ